MKRLLANGYLLGILATAVILLYLHALRPVFAGAPPLHPFLIAIVLAAWRGGLRAGLSTLLLATVASVYCLLQPFDSFGERLRIGLLVLTGTISCLAIVRLRRAERQALRSVLKRESQLKHEIAERKQAQEALQKADAALEHRIVECTGDLRSALQTLTEQSRYLEAFFRHAMTPLVLLDRDFNFIRVNEAHARACRKTVAEFPGRNLFEFCPFDDRSVFEGVLRTRRPFQTFAHPFVFPEHPEWGVSYWNWTLTPLLNERDEVDALVLALEDVTARKLAALELEQHRRHLEALVKDRTRELESANVRLEADIIERERVERKRRELESTLTKIASTAPGVICLYRMRPDGSACFPYASPGIEDIYGIPPDALAEDAAPVFQLFFPDDIPRVQASLAESARTLTLWQDEWRVCHHDRGEIWIEGRSVPEREPDGSTLWYGFIHDVTERKRTEQALREADRRKNEFLAMLGHELRNPLAPIRNAVEIMSLLNTSDPRLRRGREIVQRQMNHLTRLVDDLLDVSRIVQGKLRIEKAPVELATVLEEAIETSKPLLDRRHQVFTALLPDTPVWLNADRVRLAQVVGNLLNNAAKYTPEGGKIQLSATLENGEAVIAVRDSGEGIPEPLLPYVFDVFTQAERTLDRSQGGLGLGLAIVQNIVAMHGGRVEAKSHGAGKGSEFVVRLPLPETRPSRPGPGDGGSAAAVAMPPESSAMDDR